MDGLLSAQEIAEKRLPGLPTTKAAVHAMARRENWYFEERTGLGGTKRLYRMPSKHLGVDTQAAEVTATVAGTIAGGAEADLELLSLAVQAVEEWCAETGRTLSPGRKGSVIAVLYDYLVKGGGAGQVKTLLQAVG